MVEALLTGCTIAVILNARPETRAGLIAFHHVTTEVCAAIYIQLHLIYICYGGGAGRDAHVLHTGVEARGVQICQIVCKDCIEVGCQVVIDEVDVRLVVGVGIVTGGVHNGASISDRDHSHP